ncbi:MAG: DUF4065 domain-containing protein, partial [Peptostreptococcaceae bacterium]|nr:DUF4065 domain-containing protein [Peptostreptococcaceae bacterium]
MFFNKKGSEEMADIVNVAKYLLTLADGSNNKVNPLKLQKLLYYCEGWTIAITDKELFPGENFQAWLHGPVNVTIYHEFNTSYGMFDPIDTPKAAPLDASVTVEQRAIIDRVFEVYNQYSGSQLEMMTHAEKPWIEARGTLGPNMHSEAII